MNLPGKGCLPGIRRTGIKNNGFTLIELMLTIIIAGILLAVGVPSFRNVTANNALRSAAADLVTAIHTGRAQAVNQQAAVTLKPNGTWTKGWTLSYTAANSVDSDQTFKPSGDVTVDGGGAGTITFQPSGLVSAIVTFKICDGRTKETGRQITVGRFGTVDNQSITCS